MPSTLNAPGIYIEEIPSGVHPISGVSTSDTAFVDWFPRGPLATPTRVTSFAEFTRVFGGLHAQSAASYAVLQYFQQGGAVAWVVRLTDTGDTPASLNLMDGAATPKKAFTVTAANPGAWGDRLQVAVTAGSGPLAGTFSIFVREVDQGRVLDREVFRNLDRTTGTPRSAIDVVNATSRLIRLAAGVSTAVDPAPGATTAAGEPDDAAATSPWQPMTTHGADTTALGTNLGTKLDTAMRTLASIEPFVFNLLCIPAMATLVPADQKALVAAATTFCASQHAFLLVDPPATTTTPAAAQGLFGWRSRRARTPRSTTHGC
jgi:phage tail sheath protein FI